MTESPTGYHGIHPPVELHTMTQFPFDQQISTFLAVCRTASLATVDDHGHPHAANIQFAADPAWNLYFVSGDSSAHSRFIAARPSVALTVYAHHDDPETIHGVQIHGQCHAITSADERERILQIYGAKFPVVIQSPAMQAMLAKQHFYRVAPTWLRWIDNRVRFGFKVEKHLAKA